MNCYPNEDDLYRIREWERPRVSHSFWIGVMIAVPLSFALIGLAWLLSGWIAKA